MAPESATREAEASAVDRVLSEVCAALRERAMYHFAASNEKKRPQWYCTAHAHAFAGLREAIGIVVAARSREAPPIGAEGTDAAPPPGMNPKSIAGDDQ